MIGSSIADFFFGGFQAASRRNTSRTDAPAAQVEVIQLLAEVEVSR